MRRLAWAPLSHRAAPSGPALSGPPYAVALRSVGGRPLAAPRAAALSPPFAALPPLSWFRPACGAGREIRIAS